MLGRSRPDRKTVFVFPGQGTQWEGMANELLATSPVFAASVAECEQALAPYVDWSLLGVLRGDHGPRLDRVDVVQPVLFAVMVSLAAVWRAHGVRPDAVVGHSQGEIAAACVAGILSLDDAAKTVALRAQALREVAGRGRMAAIRHSAADLGARLRESQGSLVIAAVNGPRSVVLSGDTSDVDRFVAELTAEGTRAVHVPVDYASHSSHVEPLARRLIESLSDLRPQPSTLPFYSTVDGGWADATRLTAGYWYRNLRRAVGFDSAVRALIESGHNLFVEVSPHPVLTSAIEETAEDVGAEVIATETLRRHDGGLRRFRRSLAEAHAHGLKVHWGAALAATPARLVDLPTYPFRRTPYWATPRAGGPPANGGVTPTLATPTGPDPVERLLTVPAADRERAVIDAIRTHTAVVCGHPGAEAIAPHQGFAELGITSLAATELRSRLSTHFGIRLAAAAVFDHPTPAALAAHVLGRLPHVAGEPEPAPAPASASAPDAEPPGDLAQVFHRLCATGDLAAAMAVSRAASLMLDTFGSTPADGCVPTPARVRAGSTGPVMVCLPSLMPLSGPQEYVRFAAALPGERDVIALPQPGYAAGERVPAGLPALVSAHLRALRQNLANGPVVLCGHSSGGLVAHAVAAGIEADGATVAGVVLLDTYWPDPGPPPDLHRAVLLAVRERGRALGGITDVGVRRVAAMGAYTRILEGWTPSRLTAPTLVVRARDPIAGVRIPAAAIGWPLPHTPVATPGDHLTIMTEHAAPLAAAVESWLAGRR